MNTEAITTAITNPTTDSPFTQNLKQQQQRQPTAKETIAANVKLLIEQLEAGHSEGLTAYLTAMARFSKYSLSNILEISRQRPSATRIAGMHAWNQLGRRVNKGEKGIAHLPTLVVARSRKRSAIPTHPTVCTIAAESELAYAGSCNALASYPCAL
jgi:hypothetical protein